MVEELPNLSVGYAGSWGMPLMGLNLAADFVPRAVMAVKPMMNKRPRLIAQVRAETLDKKARKDMEHLWG